MKHLGTMYRIYLGSDNLTKKRIPCHELTALIGTLSRGATFFKATGVWEGGEEKSWVIDVVGEDTARDLSEAFCKVFRQNAVLVCRTGEVELVEREGKRGDIRGV